jgi:hypothetical protein
MLEKNIDDHKIKMEDILYALRENYRTGCYGSHCRAVFEG